MLEFFAVQYLISHFSSKGHWTRVKQIGHCMRVQPSRLDSMNTAMLSRYSASFARSLFHLRLGQMIKYVHHCRIAILGRTPDAELALMCLDPLFDAGRAYPVKPGKGVFTLRKPCAGTRTALVRYLLQLMDRTIPLSHAKYDVTGGDGMDQEVLCATGARAPSNIPK